MKPNFLTVFKNDRPVKRVGYLLATLLVFTGLLCARVVSATTVYMNTAAEQSRGVVFGIDIRVDAVSNAFGAAFDLIYDPEFIAVVDSDNGADGIQPEISEGDWLSNTGADATFVRSALEYDTAGTVVVGISRAGEVAGVDALSDTRVVTVNFVARKLGTTSINFGNPGVIDPDNTDIAVASWDGITITIIPLAPGDFNGSKTVDLQDAILACQIVCRSMPAIRVYHEGDMDGDGKIGAPDAICILQTIAELRN